MKGGRKNLKRAAQEQSLTLQEGQIIMQVVSLRGSNLIEVMDASGEKSLALFPAKFQKSMWIKIGSFVVVDQSGKEKVLGSGCKVACIVSQVLFYEQVRLLKKSPEWPEAFKVSSLDDSNGSVQRDTSKAEAEAEAEPVLKKNVDVESDSSEEDDGLPPLEANTNRVRPAELEYSSGSDTDS